ncbi:AP-3 complex subunit delta, partial [Ascosphaera pollenicola]
MAEKRKSSDAVVEDKASKRVKHDSSKKKHRKKERENDKEKPAQSDSSKSSSSSRLKKLRKLVEELTSSPESVQSVIAEAGPNLMDAVRDLGQALLDPSFWKHHSSEDSAADLPEPPPILDEALKTAAFTHQSMSPDDPEGKKETNYDRLEFLGDAFIQVLSTRFAWTRFKHLRTGRISQIRELLVNNETLGTFAVAYGFDQKLRVKESYRELPKLWPKIKGDVFEAYVGAAILSNPINGFDLVEDWLTELWTPKVEGIAREPPVKHYKEDLAKKIAGKGIKIQYIDEGPAVRHKMGVHTFYIGVYLTGWGYTNQHLGSGTGPNKVEAGNEAALRALENHPLIDEIAATKQEFDAK